MEVLPPQYSGFGYAAGLLPSIMASGPDSELPAYSRRRHTLAQPIGTLSIPRAPTEHIYPLVDGRSGGKPWATLKIFSSAKSSKSLPTFFEKENINGSFELHAERGDSIQAVTATITGRIITGANSDDSFTFLSHCVPIWSKSPDVPRLPSSSEGTTSSKLLGHCVWQLSLPIPRTVNLPVNGAVQTFRLPETFLERNTRASIQYDFCVLISRGKLRADSQIKTPFGYIPSTRPEAASMLRQLAYQQKCAVPGPDIDPQGWKSLKSVSVSGIMSKSRKVEAACKLSLSRPLCYTRGTVIPCHLSLSSANRDLLDLLSNPASIKLVLRRKIRYSKIHQKKSSLPSEVTETEDDVSGTFATWWQSISAHNTEHERFLDGEIKLEKDLRPSSEMGHFSISYSVVLYAFKGLEGFKLDSGSPMELLKEPVEVATMHAKGPRVVAYSPPAYDSTGNSTQCSRGQRDFESALSGNLACTLSLIR